MNGKVIELDSQWAIMKALERVIEIDSWMGTEMDSMKEIQMGTEMDSMKEIEMEIEMDSWMGTEMDSMKEIEMEIEMDSMKRWIQ